MDATVMHDLLIQTFRTRVVTVQAVQWTGDNISTVQRLLAPASPLWSPEGHGSVGVNVDKPRRSTYDSATELQHADKGDWIVKYPSGRVVISKAGHFADFYEPVEARDPLAPVEEIPPTAPTATAAFPLGAPITATHPRALEDRQPETETDGVTVSERAQ